MRIDLIAIDLDDTLLRADLRISDGNKRALARAAAKGIRVILASGRNVHSMRSYAEELGLLGPGDYMICSNGAEILHSASGRVLDERRLDPPLCREIARAIDERGFPWQVYEEGIIHVGARFPEGSIVKDKHSGSVDHIAFKASGAADFRKRLKKLGVDFEEQNIENAGYQVFLYDPVGTKLEFNFLNEVVPDAVALGTTAGANTR